MKHLRYLLFAMLLLALALPVLAAEKTYTHFSVNVPEGWQIQEKDTSCGFMLPEKKLLMLVSASEDDITQQEFMDAFQTEWKVKEFTQITPNWFSFTSEKYAERGMHVRGFIGKDKKLCKYVVLSGDGPELDALHSTLKFF